jgi:hypothetical protein
VRRGEDVLVTDRGEVVATLRLPDEPGTESPYPALVRLVRPGKVRLGATNSAELYPQLPALLIAGRSSGLLDAERGER